MKCFEEKALQKIYAGHNMDQCCSGRPVASLESCGIWDEQLTEGEKWSGCSYQKWWVINEERIWANYYKMDVAWNPVGVVSSGTVSHGAWKNHGVLFSSWQGEPPCIPLHSKHWEAQNPTHGSHDLHFCDLHFPLFFTCCYNLCFFLVSILLFTYSVLFTGYIFCH